MNIAHWLVRRAALAGAAPALFTGQTQVANYAGFARQAAAVGGWLQAQGIIAGDRVAIFNQNVPEYLVALYGIWMVGAAAVPVNAKLHTREAAFILGDAGARVVFASPSLAQGLRVEAVEARIVTMAGPEFETVLAAAPLSAVADRGSEDLAWLFYTSGTTGAPKGVMITHGMLASMALSYTADVDSVRAEDTTIYAAPMSHGAGLYNVMHVQAGARHVCPVSGGFDAAEVLDLAAHFGAAHLFAAPTMVKRITEYAQAAGQRGAGLRSVIYAGGPMYNADIIAAVSWFGPVFVQIYGLGECPMGITVLPRADVADRSRPDWQARLASVGYPQAAVEVRIGDGQGRPLEVGAQGEIMVRGRTVMSQYWNNPQATQKILIDGWLMTGDLGFVDAQGYVTLQDRSKDMIITGGSNVYPREVEEVLLTHPQLREVSVVGRVHPEWGEEVVAFVVGDAPEAELDQLCLDNIARFKRPKEYIRLTELPKNNYGKVLKTELRAILAARGEGSA